MFSYFVLNLKLNAGSSLIMWRRNAMTTRSRSHLLIPCTILQVNVTHTNKNCHRSITKLDSHIDHFREPCRQIKSDILVFWNNKALKKRNWIQMWRNLPKRLCVWHRICFVNSMRMIIKYFTVNRRIGTMQIVTSVYNHDVTAQLPTEFEPPSGSLLNCTQWKA